MKEYSRSSADQEVPLPHDLRPAPVLEMTMMYLLKSIADTGNQNNWEEWYDFLWSRMRGIRKVRLDAIMNANEFVLFNFIHYDYLFWKFQ